MSQEKTVNAPPTFKDAKNRTWTIKLSLDLIDSVQQATQIDLAPDDDQFSHITQLLFSPRKLGALLWECCRQQADKESIDRKSFFEGLEGEALANGWGAVVDAIVFFIQSRSPKVAEAVRMSIEAEMKVIDSGAESIRRAMSSEETAKAFEGVATNLQKEMQAEIEKACGSFALNSPA